MTVLIVLGLALALIVLEIKSPGHPWPVVQNWYQRAILLNLVQVLSVFLSGLLWQKWFASAAVWHMPVGTFLGAVIGYFVITFIYYWWHRARHKSQFLWNWFHQIHHSASRIEILTSFYKHPIEIFFNSVLSAAILYFLLGLPSAAASLAILFTGIGELIYHWNARTPYWMGFIFQRPESHRIHHQLGLHDYNYSDLPLWDMLFGTFRNPREWNKSCGYKPEREARFKDMMLGVDVNAKLKKVPLALGTGKKRLEVKSKS